MAPLEPRSVELSDVRLWLRETVALFARKPLAFLGLSLLFFYIAHRLHLHSLLTFVAGLVLCKVSLVIGLVVANDADAGRVTGVSRCYEGMRNAILVVTLECVFYLVVWIAASNVAERITVDVPFNDYTDSPVFAKLQWLYPGTVALFVVYIGVMVSTLWFLLPLSVFHRVGVLDAIKLAKHGERLNFRVVMLASYGPFAVFFLVFLLSEAGLLLAFAGLPLFSIYLFVSYRHVYLGRRDNSPAPVAAATAASRTA